MTRKKEKTCGDCRKHLVMGECPRTEYRDRKLNLANCWPTDSICEEFQPKKRRKPKTQPQEKVQIKCSPGFFKDGFIFEQIEDLKYARGDTVDLKEQYVLDDVVYEPLPRCPWPLATKPIEYSLSKKLWDEVRQFIYDHLFLPSQELYDVLTAWVLATWIGEIWPAVPYIFFYGPIASGKTRGLEVLHRLCYRGILAGNISAAALFRSCEQWHPTLFLDETEIYNRETKSEVVGLLNSGYRRGQYAIRVKQTQHGSELEVFDVFGFKALAGTKGLAQALESRSIMIRMLKARRPVKRSIEETTATVLRNKLLGWRLYTLATAELSELFEHFCEGIPPLDFADGRLIELYSCLFAVSNEGHENILKHAKKTFEIRQFEEKASVEAEIIEILSKNELNDEKGIVLTKDLTEIFNSTRLDGEKWKTRSVGWKLRGLGFIKIHTGQGNGWLIDEDRLRYLQQIYGIETASPEKLQNVQKVHEDINEMFAGKKSPNATLRDLEDVLRNNWQTRTHGTIDDLKKVAQQKGSLNDVETESFVDGLFEAGKIAYDPDGWLKWLK